MAIVNFRVPSLPIPPSQRNPWKLITSHQGQDGVGWGVCGGGGDGFLKQKRTYPNHLLDSCRRFWSKHNKTHGKTTSFTCNIKKTVNWTLLTAIKCTAPSRGEIAKCSASLQGFGQSANNSLSQNLWVTHEYEDFYWLIFSRRVEEFFNGVSGVDVTVAYIAHSAG